MGVYRQRVSKGKACGRMCSMLRLMSQFSLCAEEL